MMEETTNLKRVKPEPGDGSTPSHKRLKPDQLERVVTPEDLRPTEDLKPKKMKVADLRAALQERGLSTDGFKAVLADRLQVVLDEAEFGLDEPAAPGAPSSETQPDESQVEITRHVDPETRAKEALKAAERAGDIIDVDALDDAAAAPVVHQPATAPEAITSASDASWAAFWETSSVSTPTLPALEWCWYGSLYMTKGFASPDPSVPPSGLCECLASP